MTAKIERKTCSNCGINKFLTQFRTDKISICKICENAMEQPEFEWLTKDQKLNNEWLTKPIT